MTGQPRSAWRRPGRDAHAACARSPGPEREPRAGDDRDGACRPRHGTKSGAIGRPKRTFDRGEAVRLRESGWSIERIAEQMHIGVGTVVRVIHAQAVATAPFQKAPA